MFSSVQRSLWLIATSSLFQQIYQADRAGNDMIYQAEESDDNQELDKENKASTENDEKEDLTADEVNVE